MSILGQLGSSFIVDAHGVVAMVHVKHEVVQAIERDEAERLGWGPFTGSAEFQAALESLLEGYELSSREAISLPDISDVSIPMMVGAMPSKPKKKTKRVKYQGVSLGRRPSEFEAFVLSLSEIPRRQDLEVARAVEELAEVRRTHLRAALVADGEHQDAVADACRADTASELRALQLRMARYGVLELRNECRRQGLALSEVPEERIEKADVLASSVDAVADALHGAWMANLRRIMLRCDRTKRSKAQALALADRQILLGLKSAARDIQHEAFGHARHAYMQRLARAAEPTALHLKTVDDDEVEKLVDYVIQSAVMDENTCDPCGDADELTFDYDDPDREFYAPPFVNCLGGGLCRCVQIYVLKDGGSWVVREDQIL